MPRAEAAHLARRNHSAAARAVTAVAYAVRRNRTAAAHAVRRNHTAAARAVTAVTHAAAHRNHTATVHAVHKNHSAALNHPRGAYAPAPRVPHATRAHTSGVALRALHVPLGSDELLMHALLFAALLVGVFVSAPRIARLARLPLITVYLLGGMCSQLVLSTAPVLRLLLHAHNGALGCITIAAGSELVLSVLQGNFRRIASLTIAMASSSLAIVLSVALAALAYWPSLLAGDSGKPPDLRLRFIVSLFAAVIAICRSPSSAIAVVSSLKADGPFTQTVLSVTMVTDVVVILLFGAAMELTDELLLPPVAANSAATGLLAVFWRFSTRALLQLVASITHGIVVAAIALPALNLAKRSRARALGLPHAALLAAAVYGFAFEHLLRRYCRAHHWPLPASFRIEPMLSCIVAGFLLCNALDRRAELSVVLEGAMPPVLAFFFFTTGAGTHAGVLLRTWPMAIVLFLAGLSLGLADEIAHQYAGWGPRLEAILVSVIVLNQIIGPPLLERSIRSAGEDNAGKISAKAAEMAIERSPLRRATLTSVSSADDLSGTELPGGVVVDAASSSPRT